MTGKIYLGIFLLACFSFESGETLNRDETINLFDNLIGQLRNRINVRDSSSQFAFLYIPNDLQAAPSTNPLLNPSPNEVGQNRRPLPQFPLLTIYHPRAVTSNYIITTPQKVNGNSFKTHTEVQLLADNFDLYNGMLRFLRGNGNQGYPKEVYMFSFFQPCFHCQRAIQTFLNTPEGRNTKFIIGFSSDEWNRGLVGSPGSMAANRSPDGIRKAETSLRRLILNLCNGKHRLVVVPNTDHRFSQAANNGQLKSGNKNRFPN